MKVLLVIDHAPDYRENFFRELALYCDLTVAAQPCSPDGLAEPHMRRGYRYVQLPCNKIGPLRWQVGLVSLLKEEGWDIRCVDLNVWQVARIYAFLIYPGFKKNWIWRGHIFGRSNNKVVLWLKSLLLRSTNACLVYSEPQAARAADLFGIRAVSFNNTEVRKSEFRTSRYVASNDTLNFLYVGRNQERKKLDRLIRLVDRRNDVAVRFVGPGMERLSIPERLLESGRVEVFGKTSGVALDPLFDWADLVANPGHVGLLVMNAARHGKGIVVDKGSEHAPEFWLAKESGQPFIDFSSDAAVNEFVDSVVKDKSVTGKWGAQLQQVAKSKYTIENMAKSHFTLFQEIANG